jgi:hypothetical protein
MTMLHISPSLFSKLIGVPYPATRPSIPSLIDSIPSDQALACLGKLIQSFGTYAPSNPMAPKSAIFHILSELEMALGEIEDNFNVLAVFYFGLKGHQDHEGLWYWTSAHKKLCAQIFNVTNTNPPLNHRILNLVSEQPSNEFISQIKDRIQHCINNLVKSSNSKTLNQYIHSLLMIFQNAGADQFGNDILGRLLTVWSEAQKNQGMPLELASLIHKLVDAVLNHDTSSVELVLAEIKTNYGEITIPSVGLSTSENFLHPYASIWDKIDPGWWKEQE